MASSMTCLTRGWILRRRARITVASLPRISPRSKSVLGGMLLSKDAIADVLERVRPSDFLPPRPSEPSTTPS